MSAHIFHRSAVSPAAAIIIDPFVCGRPDRLFGRLSYWHGHIVHISAKKSNALVWAYMIARIAGTVIGRGENTLIVDTGGVGYLVHTPPIIAQGGGTRIELWTYLAVRENALDLYGFTGRDDVRFFELLLSVSGIGPKGALSILSLATAETLRKSIARADPGYLQRVHGIGKKISEKLVLELKNKVGALPAEHGEGPSGEGDVVDAIISLGYSAHEARAAVQKLPEGLDTVEAKIKAALKQLA